MISRMSQTCFGRLEKVSKMVNHVCATLRHATFVAMEPGQLLLTDGFTLMDSMSVIEVGFVFLM